jgi:hypothetical protein
MSIGGDARRERREGPIRLPGEVIECQRYNVARGTPRMFETSFTPSKGVARVITSFGNDGVSFLAVRLRHGASCLYYVSKALQVAAGRHRCRPRLSIEVDV